MPIKYQYLEPIGGGGSSQFPIDLIFPVGSVITNSSATFDPNKLYEGTTWQRIKGRVIVGVDENDASFNSINKLGGHKELQSHTHTGSTDTSGSHYHSGSTAYSGDHLGHYSILKSSYAETTYGIGSMTANGSFHGRIVLKNGDPGNISSTFMGNHNHSLSSTSNAGSHSHSLTINSSGSGNGGNLPPYITKYVWERTA